VIQSIGVTEYRCAASRARGFLLRVVDTSKSDSHGARRADTIVMTNPTTKSFTWGRFSWLLVLAGLALLGVCLYLRGLSEDAVFDHGQGYEERPILALVFALVFAGATYFIVSIGALRRAPSLGWVLFFGVLFRVVLIESRPLQEDDIYRYVWDGKVVAARLDPYVASPYDVLFYPEIQPDGEDALTQRRRLQLLSKIAARSEANLVILQRVNNAEHSTIYPAVLQYVFAIHGAWIPHDWEVDRQVIAMKWILGLFELGILALVPVLLRLARLPMGLTILYAWCPLVLKECSNSGHADSVPTFLVVASLCAVLAVPRAREAPHAIGWILAAGFALGLAIAAKLFAVLLVPIVWRRLGFLRGAIAIFAVLNVLAVHHGLFPAGAENRSKVLKFFALEWEAHCGVFVALREGIEFFTGDARKLIEIGGREMLFRCDGYYARIISGVCIVCVALWGAWKSRPSVEPARFLERCFLTLAALFLLGPVGFPWYFVWCVPLLPFVTRRVWLMLPGISVVYYLGFWYEYRYDVKDESWLPYFELVVVLEFLIFFAALGYEIFATKSSSRRLDSADLTAKP
jgi:hypothetical protein